MRVPTKITVLVDSREKIPLLFPEWIKFHPDRTDKTHLVKINTRVKRLFAGDYCLDGGAKIALIERKGSLRELHQNLMTDDWARTARAFEKTMETEFVYLLLDMNPSDMFVKSKEVPDPHKVFDRLCQTVSRFNLGLWWAGNCKGTKARRRLGEQVVRLLMAHMYSD